MLINCDIGERGAAHSIDDALMACIDIANIACGGHAGDKRSIRHYQDLARDHGVRVSAHLSYPDRQGFGRTVIPITTDKLLCDLEMQLQMIGTTESVKLHGALYNEANRNHSLAKSLAEWFKKKEITTLLTPEGSALEHYALLQGITILNEAFLDRRYILGVSGPEIAPRHHENALITSLPDALQQYRQLSDGYIIINDQRIPLKAHTLCIHSDAPAALDIAQAIARV